MVSIQREVASSVHEIMGSGICGRPEAARGRWRHIFDEGGILDPKTSTSSENIRYGQNVCSEMQDITSIINPRSC
jgi:hypothetical protein